LTSVSDEKAIHLSPLRLCIPHVFGLCSMTYLRRIRNVANSCRCYAIISHVTTWPPDGTEQHIEQVISIREKPHNDDDVGSTTTGGLRGATYARYGVRGMQHTLLTDSMIVTRTHSIPVASGVNGMTHAGWEHGWCGSMAAALQTSRHVHDERARQPIQRVMVLEMVVSTPRCHTSRIGSRDTVVIGRRLCACAMVG